MTQVFDIMTFDIIVFDIMTFSLTNNRQPFIKSDGKWLAVNSKKDADSKIIKDAQEDGDQQMNCDTFSPIDSSTRQQLSRQQKPMRGRERDAFREVQNNDKLDKLCSLIESVLALVASPLGKHFKQINDMNSSNNSEPQHLST